MPAAALAALATLMAGTNMPSAWVEGEGYVAAVGSRAPDIKPAAGGGELLGSGWGAARGHFARWLVYWRGGEATLHIRYARAPGGPARFQLSVDGRFRQPPVVFSGATGGWGERPDHFRWASVHLGPLQPGFHTVELRALADGANTNIDALLLAPPGKQPPGPRNMAATVSRLLNANRRGALGYVYIEGEEWARQKGSLGPDTKPAAIGGQVLGNNWGASADHWAEWQFQLTTPLPGATAYIRYCRLPGGDAPFDVALDGKPVGSGTVVFAGGTGGWGEKPQHFRIASVPLGNLGPGQHCIRLSARRDASNVNIDGIFVAARGFVMPAAPAEQARLAEAYFINSTGASRPRALAIALPTAPQPPRQPALVVEELLRRLPQRTRRVVQTLAQTPWPNLVAAYDVSPTDYNNDLTWLDLRKEKHFRLPHAGELGLVQPHTDFYFLPSLQLDRLAPKLQWQPVVHIANALAYRAELGGGSFAEAVFVVRDSRTLAAVVTVHNASPTPLSATVAASLHHPEAGRRPPQRFGRLIACRTGPAAWVALDRQAAAALICCDEYPPGSMRPAGKLVACLAAAPKPARMGFSSAPGGQPSDTPAPAATMLQRLTVPPRQTKAAAFAAAFVFFNNTRDVPGPRGTVTYRKMTDEAAAREAFVQARSALAADVERFLARSLRWYRRVPALDVPQPTWERDFYTALELPRCETLSPYGNMPVPFYNFCRAVGNNLYQWWSYGMHAHESLACFAANVTEPALSESFLRGHFLFQNEDGGVPYGVSPTSRRGKTTGRATMPVLVWEAWETYLWSGDKEFLRLAYQAGKRLHDWWLRTRDRTGEGLVHWLDFAETVRDDPDVPTWLVSGGAQFQEALDLNCYILKQERCLAAMAQELGRPSEARRWLQAADRRVRLMNAYMWDEHDGCYYGINEVVPQKIKIKDCSTFYPLWCALAPTSRARRVVSLLTDAKKFWLPYPVPSVARDEPLWGADWHWHGPNWVEMVWPTLRGLRDYGYFALAAELAYRNCEMVFTRNLEADGHFREYYNPLTGKGAAGCLYDYVWAAVPAAMVVETFAGVRPRPEGLEILPALPRRWDHLRLEGLNVRGRRIDVEVVRSRGLRAARALVNGRSWPTRAGRGVLIPWRLLGRRTRVEITQPWRLPQTHALPVKLPPLSQPVAPHRYPNDPALVARVRKAMTTPEKLRRR